MKGKFSFWLAIVLVVLLVGFFIYKYISSNYLVVPEIKLKGDNPLYVDVNKEFKDPGYQAFIKDKEITDNVKVSGEVNIKKIGEYSLKYSVTNLKGKKKVTIDRKVIVKDSVKPKITLKGGNAVSAQFGQTFSDPGYKATDNLDGNITSNVKVSGQVNTEVLGSYELTYEVTDSSTNKAVVKRTVNVVDTLGPTITLKGYNPLTIPLKSAYKDPGYTAIDNLDGDVTNKVAISGSVNGNVAGVYYVTYSVTDSKGNYNYVVRTVYVGTEKERNANTYVEVSIDSQYIWFYKNGKLLTSSSIVSGTRNKNDTPRGNFRILSKNQGIYLTGPDYKSYVNYWMKITESQVGLHDALWRSAFGGNIYLTNGSHGCINLPYGVAQTIYNNAPVGTLVKVY